ncbi:glutathionylspermidine synthase family protein [Lysinibacillus odysseyi]|uniref:Glutathionylspermidine synthase n=1 Tax=Lysinibacillus odysseyi 34hs-1 = NBRC 100172 TaxID=1220589 RepID=A0A0A3IKZ7_9BACI|nr:glutathionylspermidine synthase family protein [Lysinibacillus odysseyi]KGR85419.1 glutathionylspermidine synthase [Lysinibacillus odysseyi 34hs-1 = NBRC 100172]
MYKSERQQFYTQIEQFWADLYDEEYALYDIYEVTGEEVEKIRLATERTGHIYFKIAHLLRNVPDETLLEMGYPEETLPFLRLKTLEAESVIARFDFIPYNGSYKCIEMNADTPTFIKELFFVNDRMCGAFGMKSPNADTEQLLKEAVQDSVAQSMSSPKAHIVFTAHEENIEDYYTALYLMQFVPGAKFTPLHQLQILRGVGLFDEDGKRIDILYRQTVPIENVIQDEDEAQNKIGLWLLELVEQNLLTIINPPSAFLLQNKAVQAVIWGLHEERHAFFSAEEHEWIAHYFLPTYLEESPFIEKGLRYVKKPVFGREGDTVEIYEADGQLLKEDGQKSYQQYIKVYQQYIEQPKTTFQSEKGKQTGEMLVGSFLISGKPGAVGLRIGGMITNNLSYYLPVGIKRAHLEPELFISE